jgi:WD40 repeat protein
MLRLGVGFEADRRTRARQGHVAPITTIEWSPDGRRLATGSYDGTVLVWDAAASSVSHTFFHPRLVNGVRWSHDGRLVASACADATCRLWDVESGRCVLVLARHTDDVVDAAWSADDRFLVTVAQDGTGRLWSAETGELFDAVLCHRNHCMSVDWDPSTGLISTCGEDSTIRLWDQGGTLVADIPQPGDLESCRWAPGGGVLAGACDTGTASLVRDGAVTGELGPLPSAAKCVSWSPDGDQIAVGSYDSACTVFDVASGRQLARFHGDRIWPRSLHWSPKDGRIAIGTFDAAPAIVEVLRGSANGAATSPSRRARSSRGDDAKPTRSVPAGPPTRGINAVAIAGEDEFLLGADDGLVWRWQPWGERPELEVAAGKPGGSLVNSLAWQPERQLLAYGTFAGEVVVSSLGDGKSASSLGAGSPVNQVAWSLDGSQLAIATYHGVVHLVAVDERGATIERSLEAHDAAVKGVAWLDGTTLVTAATDRLAKVISTSGETLALLAGHGNLLNGVAVTTGDGPRLVATVSRDRTARLWDPATGSCIRVLCGHDESVKAVAWQPGSSRFLLTGSYDFDARLWDLEADEEGDAFSIQLHRHRNGVGAVNWWGDHPVTTAWDTTCVVWHVADGTPRELAAVALSDAADPESEARDEAA